MKTFPKHGNEYRAVSAVRHQGFAVVAASRSDGDGLVYDYRVLDTEEYDESAALDEDLWSDTRQLSLPGEVRSVGMSLVDYELKDHSADTDAPFVLATDQSYVYLFRRSSKGTLLMNRYMLSLADRSLQPAWETRYRRSGTKDYTPDRKDTFGARDMAGKPYLEPVFELPMITVSKGTSIAAGLTRNQVDGTEFWHLFAVDDQDRLTYFRLRKGDDGVPNVSDKEPGEDGRIPPDAIIPTPDLGSEASPSVTTYCRQESVGEDSATYKRAIRMMLAIPTGGGVAVLDFGVAGDGTLVQMPSQLPLGRLKEPGEMPILHTDDRKLTLSGAILGYVTTEKPVHLLDSADGRVYLHAARQDPPEFAYTIFSPKTSRATCELGTSDQQVKLEAVARLPGSQLNGATLKVTPSTVIPSTQVEGFVDLLIQPHDSSGLGAEHWCGIPAVVEAFEVVVAGRSISDPDDARLRAGTGVFFDGLGKSTVFAGPLRRDGEATGAAMLVQSYPPGGATEAKMSCHVMAGESPDTCNVHVALTLGGIELGEQWTGVPRAGDGLQQVLNGTKEPKHPAHARHPVCKVQAGKGSLWLISREPDPESVVVEIDNVSGGTCDVRISVQGVGEPWPNAPSDARELAKVLNGEGVSGKASALVRCCVAGHPSDVATQRVAAGSVIKGGSGLVTCCISGSGGLSEDVQQLAQSATGCGEGGTSELVSLNVQAERTDLSSVFVSFGTATTSGGKNPRWLPAKTRPSIMLDNRAIEVAAQKSLDIDDRVSVEAWVRTDGPPNRRVSLFQHGSATGPPLYSLGLFALPGQEKGKVGVYGTVRETAVVTTADLPPGDSWRHVAFTCQMGYSLEFDGTAYVDCGAGGTLNPGQTMTIEAWVKADRQTKDARTIVSKYGATPDQQSYRLTLEGREFVFRCRRSGDDEEVPGYGPYHEFTASVAVPCWGEWVHVAATMVLGPLPGSSGASPDIRAFPRVFANGHPGNSDIETIGQRTRQVNVSDANFFIGGIPGNPCEQGEGPPPSPEGSLRISEVRLWNRLLSWDAIRANYQKRQIAEDTEGLISYWTMSEGSGRDVNDKLKVNKGLASRSDLWRTSRQGAAWCLLVDGHPQPVVLKDAKDFADYGEHKTLIGDPKESGDRVFVRNLDELRVWNRCLTQEEVWGRRYAALAGCEPGLVAYWPFDEGTGATVRDMSGHGNDGTFASSIVLEYGIGKQGHYSPLTVTLALTHCTVTRIEDREQLPCVMHLRSEANAALTPFWDTSKAHLRLDIGQERKPLENGVPVDVSSATGKPIMVELSDQPGKLMSHSLEFHSPWDSTSAAPVGADAPWCREVPDGRKATSLNESIRQSPAVIEYGDVQRGQEGNLRGVMKRAHAYIWDSEPEVRLRTGFSVGETGLEFVGQVQTRPTLIGFVEGAPPVPSENLTVNDPRTDDYVGTSSISLTETRSESYTYTGSTDSYFDMGLDSKTGLTLGTKVQAGLGVETEVFKADAHLGIHLKSETSVGWLSTVDSGVSTEEKLDNDLDLCGFWEAKKDYGDGRGPRYVNPEVGSRYLPNNMGYALVRSGVADLYVMRMSLTGAVVSYVLVPDRNIPKDWNIIMFPLNPSYVKNGTLDGMVGLVADPDYPGAISGERGSYFKPVEAYALKRKIDRERETIKTYFMQQATDPWSLEEVPSSPQGKLLRDWGQKQSKRSLVNTYVWTAQGGLYAQEEQFADVRHVSHGGSLETGSERGLYAQVSMRAGGVGLETEADVLVGSRWESTVVTAEDLEDTFGLHVQVTGEGWINKRSDPATRAYEEFDCPGKVEAYRFMSYYCARITSTGSSTRSWTPRGCTPATATTQSRSRKPSANGTRCGECCTG